MNKVFESYEEFALISLFVFRNYVPAWLLTVSLSLPLMKFAYRHLSKHLTVDLDTELSPTTNNNFHEKYSHLINITNKK